MAKTTQTWSIKGQTYTHPQLMELKKQGLDPRKDNIVMKFLNPGVKPTAEETAKLNKNLAKRKAKEDLESRCEKSLAYIKNVKIDDPDLAEKLLKEHVVKFKAERAKLKVVEKAEVKETEEQDTLETEEQEFTRLKQAKAWVNPKTKERYKELKAKFAK